jgi:hypothetical protein
VGFLETVKPHLQKLFSRLDLAGEKHGQMRRGLL